MSSLKLPFPRFENDVFKFRVTFLSLKISEEFGQNDKVILNKRQEKAIECLKKDNIISTKRNMELNKVSDKTAFLELKDMLLKDILTKEGRGRAIIYKLNR